VALGNEKEENIDKEEIGDQVNIEYVLQ